MQSKLSKKKKQEMIKTVRAKQNNQ